MFKRMIITTAAVAVVTMFAAVASAQQPYGNNLFGQYSTYGANQVNASMYPAPHPVPGYVGGSMYTYEPLMPHEMMYTHQRNYYNYYGGSDRYYQDPYGARRHAGGGSLNITRVRWQSGANSFAPLPYAGGFGSSLHYKWAQYYYCISKGGRPGNCHSKIFGGGLRNHFGGLGGGCASGNCGTASVDSGYSYEGDYTTPSAGCTSCTANLTDSGINTRK